MSERIKVVGVARVSTEEQSREGVSLAIQRARMEAYATALDLELVHVYEDGGYSGKNLKRPGIQAALRDLDEGRAAGLLVFKLDRLTRSTADMAFLLDRYFRDKFALMSVCDSLDTRTAAGRMVIGILTTVFQWEREAISERTAGAMAYLRSQGITIGAIPFGWRLSEKTDAAGRKLLEPDPDELETAGRIAELRAEGRTLRDMAQVLAAERRPTKRGGRWAPETIRKLIARIDAAKQEVNDAAAA